MSSPNLVPVAKLTADSSNATHAAAAAAMLVVGL